jgi:hypothetical protein
MQAKDPEVVDAPTSVVVVVVVTSSFVSEAADPSTMS